MKLSERIELTVHSVYSMVEKERPTPSQLQLDEYLLRKELVCCILSSRVRFEMASRAIELIEQAGLLDNSWWDGERSDFRSQVSFALSGQSRVAVPRWSYRFHKTRSEYLARARDRLAVRSMSDRLSEFPDPFEARRMLVKDFSGLGPKQSSMFLRNIGRGSTLAILDTHILRFMQLRDLITARELNVGDLKSYERIEQRIAAYASQSGFQLGTLDWAVWATMRAASELGL
jgi:N-glycosylase/DNA lyase